MVLWWLAGQTKDYSVSGVEKLPSQSSFCRLKENRMVNYPCLLSPDGQLPIIVAYQRRVLTDVKSVSLAAAILSNGCS